jgi:hypothetical protein
MSIVCGSGTVYDKAIPIHLTSVDKLAFSVQIVKGKKYLHKTSFE